MIRKAAGHRPPLQNRRRILLFRLVRVLQRNRLVEDGLAGNGVLVLHVVAGALELHGDAGGVVEQGGLGNPIGLPIAAEHTTDRGFVQEFNGGRIFWEARDTPEFAAYVERN